MDIAEIKNHELFKSVDKKHRDEFFKVYEKGETPYDLFEEFTLKAINSGRKHYGAKAIAELVRWHTATEAKKGRVQNSHITMYARYFMYKYPEHKDFFRLRHK